MRLPFVSAPQRKVKIPKVNLYPSDPFFDSVIGRAMKWLVGAGRHLIIFTELIVITSFFSRFYLDKQLTDLNVSLLQKQAVVESYGDLEERFRLVQNQVEDVDKVMSQQGKLEVFTILKKVTPPDVEYQSFSLGRGSVAIQGRVGSLRSLSQLVENLKATPEFQRISVSQIERGDSRDPSLQFSIRFIYTKALKEFKSTT
jgi:hypothetical protein